MTDAMNISQSNRLGLSKKTNIAIAAVSGITIVANSQLWQSVVAIVAITIIALYSITRQANIDEKK